MMSFLQAAALLYALASTATAHGTVSGIIANGQYHQGYSPSMQYLNPIPVVVGWSIPEDINIGPIAPDAYTNPDIICHKGATNAGTHAEVAAGSDVQLQWTPWIESHHGPVIDYLAACNGDCETVDKTRLEWFKIDGVGLIDDSSIPGKWASDQLIAANNSWTVTIPAAIAPGNYVLRHEIIALHNANYAGGAQNYPQCVNLAVTGSGTDVPAGTLGTALYGQNDPGIFVDIYNPLSSYTIPGPTPYGASSGTRTAAQTSSVAVAPTIVSSTFIVIATSAAASSATPASVLGSSASAAAPVAASSSAFSSAFNSAFSSFSDSTSSATLSSTAPTDTPASTPAAYFPAAPTAATPSLASSTSSAALSYVTPTGIATSTAAASSSTGASSAEAPSAAAPTVLTPPFPNSTVIATPSATTLPTDVVPPTAVLPTSLPSDIATATLPTALPTGNDASFSVPPPTTPHKPLPAGTTYQDFLDWVEYVRNVFAKAHGGRHPRDLGGK